MQRPAMNPPLRLPRFAWAVLAFNLAVILWGAYVRATGSGAGCGGHWPLCNGEAIPRAPSVATMIEYSHRVSSGLALLAVVALAVATWRGRPKGDPARRGALAAVALMVSEAALGAALVLFRLVAENESMARAMFVGAHLFNTFLLLGALALTAHWAAGGARIGLAGRRREAWSFAIALLGLLIVGTSGAVAALGDTLHPATTLTQALQQDLSPTSQLLLRLRVLHPLLAAATAVFLLMLAVRIRRENGQPEVRNSARRVILLVLLQIALGLANMGLLAPIWLQLVHLLLADFVWLATTLFAARVFALEADRSPKS